MEINEMNIGGKGIYKVLNNGLCYSIGIPNKDKLELWLDSVGKTNRSQTRNKWLDYSSKGRVINLNNFDYNYKNGWDKNSLHLDGVKSFCCSDLSVSFTAYTVSISCFIPEAGELLMSAPGFEKIYTLNGRLYIKPSVGQEFSCVYEKNKFLSIILTLNNTKLLGYINGVKLIDKDYFYKSNKSILCFGKYESEYKEFYLHSAHIFSQVLDQKTAESLYRLEEERYSGYNMKDIILDLRGFNRLINYGGIISAMDNSIKENHLRVEKCTYHNFRNYNYTFNGKNYLFTKDRPFLNNSFTIELLFLQKRDAVVKNMYLIGKGELDKFGIEVYIINKELVIRFNNEESNNELRYTFNNRQINHIAYTYDIKLKTVILYLNGFMVAKKENVELKSSTEDLSLYIGYKPDSEFDGFYGNIFSCRIYENCLNANIVRSNYEIDYKKYKIQSR